MKAQAVAEFAITLGFLSLLLIGGWIWNDTYYRMTRLQLAAGLASRAAAHDSLDPEGAARVVAQQVLQPLVPADDVQVVFVGPSPCGYNSTASVRITVKNLLSYSRLVGALPDTLYAERSIVCEPWE